MKVNSPGAISLRRKPRAEIYIEGGKALAFSSNLCIKGADTAHFDDPPKEAYAEFYTIIEEILKRAYNLDSSISSWSKWRIFVAPAVFEAALLIYGIYRERHIGDLITMLVIGALMTIPFGYVWEKNARKILWVSRAGGDTRPDDAP